MEKTTAGVNKPVLGRRVLLCLHALTVSFSVLVGAGAGAASASPVLVDGTSFAAPTSAEGAEASFGEEMDLMARGLLVHSRRALESSVANYMVAAEGTFKSAGSIESAGTIAGGEHTIVSIDPSKGSMVLRVFRVDSGQPELVQEIVYPADQLSTGAALTVSDRVLVVETSRGAVDIYDHASGGDFSLIQSLDTELRALSIDVSNDTELIAISGSLPTAEDGDLMVLRRDPEADTYSMVSVFSGLGGGVVLVDRGSVFVQQNRFFAREVGRFSVIGQTPTGEFRLQGRLRGAGSSVAANAQSVLVGNPVNENVVVFDRPESDAGFYPYSQSIGPNPDDELANTRFGRSVVATSSDIYVGAPGETVDGVTNEGAVHVRTVVDGPIGCTIVGTEGDDIIVGTSGRDVICGLGGNDTISGLSGDDVIYGGPGDDIIEGASGRDYLDGGDGNDTIRGGPDRDAIFGWAGDDTLSGGAGNDAIHGGDGNDAVSGGDDDDTVWGDGGNDSLLGEEDNDVIYGGSGDDLTQGGDDDDQLFGGAGNDRLLGGSGNDALYGESGWDVARGEEGELDHCDRSNEVCTGASRANAPAVKATPTPAKSSPGR